MESIPFDLSLVIDYLLRIGSAFLIALPIGWERERESRIMGLRTFPLVAVASCSFVLLGLEVSGDSPDAKARIFQGLMTGMGFIGGGAILKGDHHVKGTATAASVWSTGAIGGAAAIGRYEIAIILAILNLIVLYFFTNLKQELDTPASENVDAGSEN